MDCLKNLGKNAVKGTQNNMAKLQTHKYQKVHYNIYFVGVFSLYFICMVIMFGW